MTKKILKYKEKGMILVLILLSALSLFLEYKYTKERQLLDEVRSIYNMKVESYSESDEIPLNSFVDTEKLMIILSHVDSNNTVSFTSDESNVNVRMKPSQKEEFENMRKHLKKKGYSSFFSQGEGKDKWDNLILTVK